MSSFWRNWFMLWCLSIGIFGVVLAGGAVEATAAPVQAILSLLSGGSAITIDQTLRFSLGVMGAVSIGWAVTLHLMIKAAIPLGAQGRPFWNAITAGMMSWFLIDSALSVATGFALNVVPNTLLLLAYLIGLRGSGALASPARPPAS